MVTEIVHSRIELAVDGLQSDRPIVVEGPLCAQDEFVLIHRVEVGIRDDRRIGRFAAAQEHGRAEAGQA